MIELEAKAAIAAYGIPVPQIVLAKFFDEVEAIATDVLSETPAIAVKLVSSMITHKSVGGVALSPHPWKRAGPQRAFQRDLCQNNLLPLSMTLLFSR